MENFKHLQGMRDLPQDSWRPLRAAQDRLREFFSLYGYRVLEPPLLEPTELFLRKSGGELAARMYTFTDPGANLVSLRPEYTSSIVRHVIEAGAAQRFPARIQYAGPVFRYEGDGSTQRQFIQVGAELLGSSDATADAEILSLSCAALSNLGLSGYRLEIGDLGVLRGLLESLGLSERAIVFILGSLTELKSGEDGVARIHERARQLRLLGSDPGQPDLAAVIAGMEEAEARELLHGLLKWAGAGSLGQRQPSDVVERLLRKFKGTDDPEKLQRGLDLALSLAQIKGEPGASLNEADALIESERLARRVLDRLRRVMDLLDGEGLDSAEIVLDFGLARGLAYYTGIVFEIVHPSHDASLGGGGRYDGLAVALGSPDAVPALGFAYSLELLLKVLEGHGKTDSAKERPSRVLVMAAGRDVHMEALRVAGELRCQGVPAETDVCAMSLEEALEYARAAGIAEVVVVEKGGKRTSHRASAKELR